jgi:WXXGXW repeat (2 copies)
MFRNGLIACVFAGILAAGAMAADVFVRVGPPVAVVERPGRAPHPGWVWTPGYHRWDGRAYVWVPGAWVVPPRRHARWVPARWVHRRRGWVLVAGHWR